MRVAVDNYLENIIDPIAIILLLMVIRLYLIDGKMFFFVFIGISRIYFFVFLSSLVRINM
jgi:hypothetical protein